MAEKGSEKIIIESEVVVQEGELKRDLKVHQIAMLSISGTIGTGLFLGSGYILNVAGSGGLFISYIFGGIIMILMLLCMGEMLLERPVAGNVQVYASDFLGYSSGFTVGWAKWLQLAITVPTQIVASSIYMKNIFPSIPEIVWIIGFAILLFILNASSAKDYGASSFVFSSIKVILVVVFVIVGLGMMTGIIGDKPLGLSNMYNNGGLFPNGFIPVMMSMMSAVFSYSGSDMFATAASESKDPEKSLPRAIKVSSISILATYAITLVVLSCVLPWAQASADQSPFAQVFGLAGFRYAEVFVYAIVVTSALSSANAHVFAAVRTLWSMGNYNQAPGFVGKINKRSIPMNALYVTMVFQLFAIAANFISPDVVYLFLTTFIGSAELLVYSLTGAAALSHRKYYVSTGGKVENLKFKIPGFPIVPITLIVLCIAVATGMIFDPTQRASLYMGAPVFIALFAGSTMYAKSKGIDTKLKLGK